MGATGCNAAHYRRREIAYAYNSTAMHPVAPISGKRKLPTRIMSRTTPRCTQLVRKADEHWRFRWSHQDENLQERQCKHWQPLGARNLRELERKTEMRTEQMPKTIKPPTIKQLEDALDELVTALVEHRKKPRKPQEQSIYLASDLERTDDKVLHARARS